MSIKKIVKKVLKAVKKEVSVVSKSKTRRVAVQKEAIVIPAKKPTVASTHALPVFEGLTVLKVLESGHTKTHNHCAMSNGTTMHVPKSLF